MKPSISTGSFENGTHTASYRVYYEDTDAAGVVYYANYLKFAERARTDWLRLLGVNQSSLLSEAGFGFVVKRCEVDFIAPARLDDALTVQTTLRELRKVRMTMHQRIACGARELADLVVTIACVDSRLKPAPIPADIVNLLQQQRT